MKNDIGCGCAAGCCAPTPAANSPHTPSAPTTKVAVPTTRKNFIKTLRAADCSRIFTPESLGHQGEGPDRAATRHLVRRESPRQPAAEPREHRDVLAAAMRVGDRRGVDARPGLELPEGLAGGRVERD